MTLILLPTVELEPSDWAEPGYDVFLGAEGWDELWGRSLQRWQVTPICPGDWLVDIAHVQSEATLTKLAKLNLEGREVKGFPGKGGEGEPDEERLSAMYGGYALFDGADRRLVSPTCCCCLGDLRTWRDAATLVDGGQLMLQMGHGTVSARHEGGDVIITQEPEWYAGEPVTTRVSAAELAAASEVAERAVEAFRQRLRASLLPLLGDEARATSVSLLLVGFPLERVSPPLETS